jgi:2-polyprenyl-6-methoxyphenol hydroxylase-like FAD-dependent oxidoreductase
LQATPASATARVGLFDRENLNLPYVQGRVALLGDAAHPQSPSIGQGVNMPIVDGYVCATKLGKERTSATTTTNPMHVVAALAAYDSTTSRKGVNSVIQVARSYGDVSVSERPFMCRLLKKAACYMPKS